MARMQIKPKDIVRVFELYSQICGNGQDFLTYVTGIDAERARKFKYSRESAVIETLRPLRRQEYRIGSRWCSQSKVELVVTDAGLRADFNPNFAPDSRDTPQHAEALEAGERFSRAVQEYFARRAQ